MKKTIHNKLYDTATAKEVGASSARYPRNDFHFWEETLYRKKTGEYFIYGVGGPASKYAVSCGQNEWCGGCKIIPVSFDKAKQWAETHLDADDYIVAFGDPEEDSSSRQTVSVVLPADVLAKLRREAEQRSRPLSEVLAEHLTF